MLNTIVNTKEVTSKYRDPTCSVSSHEAVLQVELPLVELFIVRFRVPMFLTSLLYGPIKVLSRLLKGMFDPRRPAKGSGKDKRMEPFTGRSKFFSSR